MTGQEDVDVEQQFTDMLQQLRVVQTGVQILSAFLLTLRGDPRGTRRTRQSLGRGDRRRGRGGVREHVVPAAGMAPPAHAAASAVASLAHGPSGCG